MLFETRNRFSQKTGPVTVVRIDAGNKRATRLLQSLADGPDMPLVLRVPDNSEPRVRELRENFEECYRSMRRLSR